MDDVDTGREACEAGPRDSGRRRAHGGRDRGPFRGASPTSPVKHRTARSLTGSCVRRCWRQPCAAPGIRPTPPALRRDRLAWFRGCDVWRNMRRSSPCRLSRPGRRQRARCLDGGIWHESEWSFHGGGAVSARCLRGVHHCQALQWPERAQQMCTLGPWVIDSGSCWCPPPPNGIRLGRSASWQGHLILFRG